MSEIWHSFTTLLFLQLILIIINICTSFSDHNLLFDAFIYSLAHIKIIVILTNDMHKWVKSYTILRSFLCTIKNSERKGSSVEELDVNFTAFSLK